MNRPPELRLALDGLINGKGAAALNPWVWVVGFRRSVFDLDSLEAA